MNEGTDNTEIDRIPRLSTLAELDFLDPVGMNWSGYEPNSSRREADDHPWLFRVGVVPHLWASSSGNVYIEL